jgi:DNA-binding MarR family transcriptional regulator
MTGFVDRMEKAGYVIRKDCPDDRRAQLICITPSGREQAGKAKPVINSVNREILSGLSKQEIAGFKKVLNNLIHSSESAR